MARVLILGSAAAASNAAHDNTYFLVQGDHSTILVDCGANPINALDAHGIAPKSVTDLILTHFHPDHVYGLPVFLMQSWLLKRQTPLPVYGLHHCLYRAEQMMDLFKWRKWENFYGVEFHRLPEAENIPVLENDDFRITSSHTRHFIPTIGLRIENKASGKVFVYSCDTAPTPRVVRLAQGADLLIHEASGGPSPGHSSAAEAGTTASQAGARRLALIHYPVWSGDPSGLPAEAQQTFNGPVELAVDGAVYEF